MHTVRIFNVFSGSVFWQLNLLRFISVCNLMDTKFWFLLIKYRRSIFFCLNQPVYLLFKIEQMNGSFFIVMVVHYSCLRYIYFFIKYDYLSSSGCLCLEKIHIARFFFFVQYIRYSISMSAYYTYTSIYDCRLHIFNWYSADNV